MSTHHVPTGSIVIAYDGSVHSERALEWAWEQARAEGRTLDVVHALGLAELQAGTWAPSGVMIDAVRESAQGLVAGAVEQVRAAVPDIETRGHVIEGDPREVLAALSRRAHLLVLGSRGRGHMRTLLLGSVSAAVSHHAACPLVVLRPVTDAHAPEGVVVGADGTVDSVPVIEAAFGLASLRSLPLTVVHCYWDALTAYTGAAPLLPGDGSELQRLLAESVAGLAEKFPDVEVTTRAEFGLVDQVLTHGGHRWDLIVVGRHNRSALERLLVGSMTSAVLERAAAPVMVVPEADSDA